MTTVYSPLLKCPGCIAYLEGEEELRAHAVKVHTNALFFCNDCSYFCTNATTMALHATRLCEESRRNKNLPIKRPMKNDDDDDDDDSSDGEYIPPKKAQRVLLKAPADGTRSDETRSSSTTTRCVCCGIYRAEIIHVTVLCAYCIPEISSYASALKDRKDLTVKGAIARAIQQGINRETQVDIDTPTDEDTRDLDIIVWGAQTGVAVDIGTDHSAARMRLIRGAVPTDKKLGGIIFFGTREYVDKNGTTHPAPFEGGWGKKYIVDPDGWNTRIRALIAEIISLIDRQEDIPTEKPSILFW